MSKFETTEDDGEGYVFNIKQKDGSVKTADGAEAAHHVFAERQAEQDHDMEGEADGEGE